MQLPEYYATADHLFEVDHSIHKSLIAFLKEVYIYSTGRDKQSASDTRLQEEVSTFHH